MKQVPRSCAAALAAAVLSGCATQAGEPVSEKLDPDTATTVTVLTRPIELFSEGARGPANDPFAYLAPFETDRMGERALYLWVSTPQNAGPLTQPQVLCNGRPLDLQPVDAAISKTATDQGLSDGAAAGASGPPATRQPSAEVDLSRLSLSRPPYTAPVPWDTQWYFKLPPEELKCMASADGIALEARQPTGNAERFSTDRKNIASLDAFTRRY